jgi:5-methyltetrahydropteroyltriglutamate--homocysteine methyltransferase
MPFDAALTGAFPRSEALVGATRDLDRGRTTREAVDALFARSEEEVVALEGRLGLTPTTGGLLRWADLFRPIAESWSGFTVGPLTRWFETNTFFRQPILHHPPERVAGAVAARLPPSARGPGAPAKAILPGPYTFAGLLENRSGETNEALVHRLGRLLAAEVTELKGLGYASVQFQEPLLVVDVPSGPRAESVVAAYRSIAGAAGDLPTAIWTFFADAGPALPLVRRIPVGSFGVDLAETEPEELADFPEGKGLGLGVIDPRTSLPEDPASVVAIVRQILATTSPPWITLGPGGPLDLLPWSAAARKLEVLPHAVAQLRASPGGANRP